MLSNPHFRGDSAMRETSPAPVLGMQFAQFPQCFEDIMIECLAERSAFIRAQRECICEHGRGVGLKIPAEVGKQWVRAVMSSPAALRATDPSKLVQYLKVRSVLICVRRGAEFWRLGADIREFCTRSVRPHEQLVHPGHSSAGKLMLHIKAFHAQYIYVSSSSRVAITRVGAGICSWLYRHSSGSCE